MHASLIKGANQFNGRTLILPIEQLVEVLLPPMLKLLVLHQELVSSILDAFDSVNMKEICPRGNNKVVIYISLYHDKCLLFMLELY